MTITIMYLTYALWSIKVLRKKQRKKDMIVFCVLSLLVVFYLPIPFFNYQVPTIETINWFVYKPISEIILKQILQVKM